MTMPSMSSYTCTYCKRKYKSHGCYKKHVLLCEIKTRTTHSDNNTVDETFMNSREMYQLLLQFQTQLDNTKQRVTLLENENAVLKQQLFHISNRTTKNTKVQDELTQLEDVTPRATLNTPVQDTCMMFYTQEDWLCTVEKPSQSFDTWLCAIETTQEMLVCLKNTTTPYTSLLQHIFDIQKSIHSCFPIMHIEVGRQCGWFIYNNNKWNEEAEITDKIYNHVIKWLWKSFQSWQHTNELEIRNNSSKVQNDYHIMLQQLCGSKKPHQLQKARSFMKEYFTQTIPANIAIVDPK